MMLDERKNTACAKRKWVEALRSGGYKQTTSCLRSAGNQFCAIGVLCDVLNPALWDDRLVAQQARYMWDGAMFGMPSKHNPFCQRLLAEVASMNDNKGKTFEEIADYLEADTRHPMWREE